MVLPGNDWLVGSPAGPLVAGNQAGTVLLAWSTERGTYLAWGSPSGAISTPQYFGRGFRISAAGVDNAGRALVVGSYTGRRPHEAVTSIGVITGQAFGPFSGPRIIAAVRRNRRGKATQRFEEPFAAIGQDGDAIIIWETWRNPPHESRGPDLLVYRSAGGRFTRPRRYPKLELEQLHTGTPPSAIVDRSGHAVLLHHAENGWREAAIAPGGRLVSDRRLGLYSYSLEVIGNENGELAIVGTGPNDARKITAIHGSTAGSLSAVETFTTTGQIYPERFAATMSPQRDGDGGLGGRRRIATEAAGTDSQCPRACAGRWRLADLSRVAGKARISLIEPLGSRARGHAGRPDCRQPGGATGRGRVWVVCGYLSIEQAGGAGFADL